MKKEKTKNPIIVVIAGPNGSGKSTTAPNLLTGALHVQEFVNADTIALGLSGFSPEDSALEAGKIMLKHMRALVEKKSSFAFETTLASRSFATWFQKLPDEYLTHIVFLWLSDVELAISRVMNRVAMGGHSIPEEVIRRRYDRGISNFFNLYMPISSSWRFYDNSTDFKPELIASGDKNGVTVNKKPDIWQEITERWSNDSNKK